jgi:hypothetical protein
MKPATEPHAPSYGAVAVKEARQFLVYLSLCNCGTADGVLWPFGRPSEVYRALNVDGDRVRRLVITISYDGKWWPFFKTTRGYSSKDQRLSLEKVPLLMSLRHVLREASLSFSTTGDYTSGGCYHFTTHAIYHKDARGVLRRIVTWTFPEFDEDTLAALDRRSAELRDKMVPPQR